ncbi:MAG: cell division protein ZipA [Pseudomonadales bacterium]|nr:cell division protein ZipA [Pseudomonadales bacterium]
MEFGPREVLIVLGALLVCGIVLDGVRRMRAARRGALRGPRRQPIFDDEGQDPLNSELPSGGARVVAVRDDDAAAEIRQRLWRDPARNQGAAPFRERTPEPTPVADPMEPGIDIAPDSEPVRPAAVAATPAAAPPEVKVEVADEPCVGAPTIDISDDPRDVAPIDAEDLPLFKGEPAPPPPARRGRKRGVAPNGGGRRADDPLEAVVLHLMAPIGTTFAARPLFQALQHAGLEFGERNIFHRPSGAGLAPAFSVANAVKPGTFEGTVRDFQTPGVAFFLVIGDVPEPLAAFDDMLAVARAVATELDAELCDERRSTLTRQAIADYRRRIQDHGRSADSG